MTLYHDFTEHGIPCVNLASPQMLWQIAKHFADLGHRSVDCLNTQPCSPLILERMETWTAAARRFGLDTVVHNHEVEAFARTDEHAHRVAPSVIANPRRHITGLFCTTSAAARGVLRASHELGIRVGPDLSLASCDNTREAKLEVPSLTTLDNPTPHAVLEQGLRWIRTGGKNWKGPLKIEPADVQLWKGESTQPPARLKRPLSNGRASALARR
ncbi:MAG: substrate-binding domain-containing protein [Tepidisphaeraceae bacterium]